MERDPLTTFMAGTMVNIVPTILDILSEIVKSIGDPELATTVYAKLGALQIAQEQLRGSGETTE